MNAKPAAPTPTRRRAMGLQALGLLLVFATASAGCRRRPRTPEDRVREAIAAAEAAIKDKNLDPIRELVSANYRDAEQNDRPAVLAMLRMRFIVAHSLHLKTRVAAVTPAGTGRLRADVFAAMASRAAEGADPSAPSGADVYRFQLTFVEEEPDVWRIQHALWGPARP